MTVKEDELAIGSTADRAAAKLHIVTEIPPQIDIDLTNDSEAVEQITAAIQSGVIPELVRNGNRLWLLGGDPQAGPLSAEECGKDELSYILTQPPFHCFKRSSGANGSIVQMKALPKVSVLTTVLGNRRLSAKIPELKPNHDRWTLRCPNGTVELLTGRLRNSELADQHTLQAKVRFDPDAGAECPKFLELVKQVAPYECCQEALLDSLAYCFTGATTEQKFFWIQGARNSGKTTVWKVLDEMLGSYSIPAAQGLLFGSGKEHSTEIVNLAGRRLILQDEIPRDERTKRPEPIRTDVINRFTSTDDLSARRAHKDHEGEVRVTWKIAITSNEKPERQGMSGDGIYRRMMLWFVKESAIGTVIKGYEHQVVAAEGPQILNLFIERLPVIRESGVRDCEHIRGEVEWYEGSVDPSKSFVREILVADPDAMLANPDIRQAWYQYTGEKLSERSTKLGTLMHENGFGPIEGSPPRWVQGDTPGRGKTHRGYRGVRIRDGYLDTVPWTIKQ